MKLLLLLILMAPSAYANQVGIKSVFGDDDRSALKSHQYPYSAIVRLENSEGGHCSGSLIGRDLVLTNSHCLITASGSKRSGIRAQIHGLAGFSPSVRVIDYELGTEDYSNEPHNDWALARLERPIGDVVGVFGLAPTATSGDGFNLVGFSGDFKGGKTAGVHENCRLLGMKPSYQVMMHDCDMTRGASGSAIWKKSGQQVLIYALNSAQFGQADYHREWSAQESNLSVPVQTFRSAAINALSKVTAYDSGLVICNKQNKKIKFALGFWNSSQSISKGWVSIAVGQCEEINIPNEIEASKQSHRIYAYSQDLDINGEFSREYCVSKYFPFEKNEGDCSGAKMKMFTSIGQLKPGFIQRIDI